MSDAEMREKMAETPMESYSFTYSEEEYREARKAYFSPATIRVVVFNVLVSAVVLYILMSRNFDFIGGLVFGVEGMAMYFSLLGLIRAVKSWKVIEPKVCASVYTYDLYEDYMYLRITRDDETVHLTKFEYADLRQKIDVGRYYLLNFSNQIYVVKKEGISETSIFHTLKPKAPEKPAKGLKALSVVLMVLSIVSGVACIFYILFSKFYIPQWWFLPAFGLIPFASMVLGLYMKKIGGGKGTFIAGLLAFALALGVFCGAEDYGTEGVKKREQILKIENYMEIYLPKPYDYDNFKDSVDGVYYEDTAMQFYEEDVDYLEGVIEVSEEWQQDLNNETYELVAKVGVADHWDYVCVYNITTDEYNKVPSKEGTYSMAAMYYDMYYNGLYVIEYEFTK